MFNLSTCTILLVYGIHTVDTHALVSYPECHCQHNVYTSYNRCRTTGAHAPAAFRKHHLSSSPWLDRLYRSQRNQVVRKILLYVRMRLLYSVKNIRNDVRRTIHIYIYIYIYRENPPFNSLMWSSLMLAPITTLQV